jgi:hypothetical protein
LAGTTRGNDFKIEKTLEGYDEDARVTIDYLCSLETCNGRIGATGTIPSRYISREGCVLVDTLRFALHSIHEFWPQCAFS